MRRGGPERQPADQQPHDQPGIGAIRPAGRELHPDRIDAGQCDAGDEAGGDGRERAGREGLAAEIRVAEGDAVMKVFELGILQLTEQALVPAALEPHVDGGERVVFRQIVD